MVDETKELLTPILGRLEETNAALDGLQLGVARLEGRIGALEVKVDRLEVKVDRLEAKVDRLEARVETVEQGLVALRQESAAFQQDVTMRLDAIEHKLEYFGEKWMEHDHAIYQLKRRQA